MLFTSKKIKTSKSKPAVNKVINLAYTSLITRELTKDKTRIIRSAGLMIIGLALVFYLGWQVWQVTLAPNLVIFTPQNNTVVKVRQIVIRGWVEPESELKMNNEIILADKDGSFTQAVNLHSGFNEFIFKAKKRYGRIAEVVRKVYLREEPIVINN